MANTLTGRGLRNRVWLAVTGILGVLTLVLTVQAQDAPKLKAPDAKPAEAKPADVMADGLKNLVRSGYTRPGNPGDTVRDDGSVVPLAFGEIKGKIIGATVYFAVFDRYGGLDDAPDAVGQLGDTWATGLGDLDTRFVPGKNFTGSRSPALDNKSRYLYLYQVVNDRGTVAPKKDGVAFAYDAKGAPAKIEDVAAFTLKLMVDPRYITSWGHFHGAGFASVVSKFDLKAQDGGVVGAVGGAGADSTRLAISSEPAIQAALPNVRYSRFAPALALGNLNRGFSVADATLGLNTTATHKGISERQKAKGVVLAAWLQNLYAGSQAPREPEFVQVRGLGALAGAGAPAAGVAPAVVPEGPNNAEVFDEPAAAIFRADWIKGQYLETGFQSSVFGFTTDLPPVDMPVRVDDAEGANANEGACIVGAAAPGMAPGTAPSPRVPVGAGATPGGMGIAANAGIPAGFGGGMGGGMGGGGFGGLGFPFIGGVGGIGMGRPGFIGGMGSNNGGGGGGGSQQQAQQAQQQQQQQQQPNTNISINNQQSQSQSQAQAQSQSQSSCGCSDGGQVVPEPTSILLGALGLPGLFVLWRRRNASPTPA